MADAVTVAGEGSVVRERLRAIWEKRIPPDVREHLARWLPLARRAGHAAGQYRRRLLGDAGTFTFTSAVVIALYAGALYALGLWWTVFLETAVGEHFVGFFGERASVIETFLDQPLWVVTGKIYLATAAAGLAVGAVGRFLLLKRYLYDFASCPIRLVVWGGATVALAAVWVAEVFSLDLRNALLVTVAPALGMFASSVSLAARLCPEVTAVGRVAVAGGEVLRRLALRWWDRR
ncbi:MAG: hypothetical protein PVF51_05530 [Nitrospirota bacterium]|jgi:hypothetical protein